MIELLGEAVSWNTGWFFGSATTAFGLPFLAQKIAKEFFKKDISVIWSLAIGFLIFVAAIIVRFISLVNEKLTQQKANFINWSFSVGGLLFLAVIIVVLVLLFNKKLVRIEVSNANKIHERDSIIVKLQEENTKRKSAEALISNQRKPFNRAAADSYYIYGEGILILKDAFARIHATSRDQNITRESAVEAMMFLCGKVRKLFEEGTERKDGKKYAVSIKLFYPHGFSDVYENRELIVVFRDSISMKSRATHYSKRSTLAASSCYEHSYLPDSESFYYINNNVPADTTYTSAFADTYWLPPTTMPQDERVERWNFPYKSELVVPLHPASLEEAPLHKKDKILGFLCVDCNDINGFHPRYDVGLLQGVADGIYDFIVQWHQERSQTNVGFTS